MTPTEREALVLERERLQAALAGIVMHWREFGEMMFSDRDDYGMDERIERAARLVPERVAQLSMLEGK